MKKQAATVEQIRFKKEEIQKLLTDTLTKIRSVITPAASVNQISTQVNNLLIAMAEQINRKVLEMASISWNLQQQQAAQQPAQTADDGNMGMGSGNFDYGTSPYMHMSEMKTTTQPKRKVSKR
jgi:hypothetical protein